MDSEVKKDNQTNARRVLNGVGYVLLSILTFVIVVISVFNLIYIQTDVSGTSMEPTLVSGNVAFVNRFIQGDKGDIVVAKVPWGTEGRMTTVVKRYVAGEGDRVKFVKEIGGEIYLYVNGEKMIEDYVDGEQTMAYLEWTLFLEDNELSHNFEIDNEGYLIIPDNHLYLLGDNREESADCSRFGPVSRETILGKVDYLIQKDEGILAFILDMIFNILRVD